MKIICSRHDVCIMKNDCEFSNVIDNKDFGYEHIKKGESTKCWQGLIAGMWIKYKGKVKHGK